MAHVKKMHGSPRGKPVLHTVYDYVHCRLTPFYGSLHNTCNSIYNKLWILQNQPLSIVFSVDSSYVGEMNDMLGGCMTC